MECICAVCATWQSQRVERSALTLREAYYAFIVCLFVYSHVATVLFFCFLFMDLSFFLNFVSHLPSVLQLGTVSSVPNTSKVVKLSRSENTKMPEAQKIIKQQRNNCVVNLDSSVDEEQSEDDFVAIVRPSQQLISKVQEMQQLQKKRRQAIMYSLVNEEGDEEEDDDDDEVEEVKKVEEKGFWSNYLQTFKHDNTNNYGNTNRTHCNNTESKVTDVSNSEKITVYDSDIEFYAPKQLTQRGTKEKHGKRRPSESESLSEVEDRVMSEGDSISEIEEKTNEKSVDEFESGKKRKREHSGNLGEGSEELDEGRKKKRDKETSSEYGPIPFLASPKQTKGGSSNSSPIFMRTPLRRPQVRPISCSLSNLSSTKSTSKLTISLLDTPPKKSTEILGSLSKNPQ